MGAPRRNRKKFQKPSDMWNKERIDEEHKLRDDYGLKNLNELWRATSEIRRIRRNVRAVLSGKVSEGTGKDLVSRLSRFGIVKDGAILDDLLEITPQNVLDRRLQSVVLRKGLAKTARQARQLIAHGFIAINGKRAKSPGYLVSKTEENAITYYKPITIVQPGDRPPGSPEQGTVTAAAAAPAAPAAAEVKAE
ncbi:MAG TPA: 30S ribosomal protein S4 [Candidatus Saccharimonadales bacterium]|nr:30S ribosomal protein S4 [Candidatus Saccharimonadales bacterium]